MMARSCWSIWHAPFWPFALAKVLSGSKGFASFVLAVAAQQKEIYERAKTNGEK